LTLHFKFYLADQFLCVLPVVISLDIGTFLVEFYRGLRVRQCMFEVKRALSEECTGPQRPPKSLVHTQSAIVVGKCEISSSEVVIGTPAFVIGPQMIVTLSLMLNEKRAGIDFSVAGG
jgi:hypothetical protein